MSPKFKVFLDIIMDNNKELKTFDKYAIFKTGGKQYTIIYTRFAKQRITWRIKYTNDSWRGRR